MLARLGSVRLSKHKYKSENKEIKLKNPKNQQKGNAINTHLLLIKDNCKSCVRKHRLFFFELVSNERSGNIKDCSKETRLG